MSKHGHNKETKNRKSWQVKESTTQNDEAPQERVDLNPSKFERLIKQKGIDVKVYRTAYCPKVKSVDGAEHEIDCTICNGSGWIDLDPIKTKALIYGQELDKMPNIEGFVDGNTVQMTFLIGIDLQYFTLVELLNFTDIFQQRLLRAPGSLIDVLKYNACRVNFIVDFDNVRYYQDQDFKINVNGDILWGMGTTPADNKTLTIHYEAAVQFRAKAAGHVNRFSQFKQDGQVEHLKFQEQWWLAKEFLVRRTDQDGNELEQGPYDNHSIVTE